MLRRGILFVGRPRGAVGKAFKILGRDAANVVLGKAADAGVDLS